MNRKEKKKDLEVQMTMSFGSSNHLPPPEIVKVERRPNQKQDFPKAMEGKTVFVGTQNLMEKVADANNLWEAWRRVRANKGSSGTDGQSIVMARQARNTKDRRILRLVVKFLKAGHMQDGVCARRERVGDGYVGNCSAIA